MYQVHNCEKRVIALFSAVIPDTACRSEIELYGLLNHKSRLFYHLLFEMEVLRKERRDKLFAPIIEYLESNNLPSNIKHQQSIISETELFIMLNNVLYHIVDKSAKTFHYKIALCIPLEQAHQII